MYTDFQNTSEQYFTRQKMMVTGDIIQVSKFAKDFSIGKRPHRIKRREEDTLITDALKESPEEIRDRSFRRAKRKLINTINTNVFSWYDKNNRAFRSVFLTLTFQQNITDIKMANYEFTKFILRMNWEILNDKRSLLKYVAVIEFQKRGAIHYHVIFFNLPFVEKETIASIWGNGYIKIKAIDDVRDVGYYVTKYMSKDFDDPRLKGNKSFFVSKGLLKPTVVYFEELIDCVKPLLPSEALEVEKLNIPIEYLHQMDYWRYNLKNHREAKQKICDLLNRYL